MTDPLEKELKLLEVELAEFSGELLEVTRELLRERVTEFPIFIAHEDEVSIGELILDKKIYEVPFNLSVSTLEDFIGMGLIQKDKLVAFKEAFANPVKNMSVFWIHRDHARYIAYPFASRNTDIDT